MLGSSSRVAALTPFGSGFTYIIFHTNNEPILTHY